MNFPFVLERKKRLRSLVLQAPAGLFPGSAPVGGLLSYLRFILTPTLVVASFQPSTRLSPTSPDPSRGARGIGPAGTCASRTSGGTAELRTAVGWEADIHRYTCVFNFSGQGGVERRPPPFFPHPLRPEARIAGLRIFIGWTSWDLRIGFGTDYHCLAIIIIIIFLPKGERQKNKTVGFI